MFPLALSTLAAAEVHTLGQDNFADFIEKNENVLVKFFAPWCGHCKNMAPAYEAASDIADKAGKVKFVEVDVTEHKEIGDKYEVKGFPTIKYFTKGQVVDYEGARDEQSFLNYIDMMTSDAITKVASMAAAKAEKPEGAVAFVGTFEKDSAEFKKFEGIASANRLIGKYYHVEGSANTVTVVREDGEVELKVSDSDLLAKMKMEKLPLFGDISGETFGGYMETGLDMIWYAGTVEDKVKVEAEIKKVAQEFRGKYNFVFIDSATFARQIDGMLGVTEDQLPKLVKTQDGPGKFIMNESVTSSNIAAWIKKIEEGSIEAVLKSEEIPESNDGPIKTLVGKTFDSMMEKDKDILLMIHAPWCGHCKKFMPEFEAAAEEIAKKSPNTMMALLDGTANELTNDNYVWTGFPTVYFKKAGETKPEKYNGERTTAGVLEFLSKAVKTPFEYEKPVEVDDEL